MSRLPGDADVPAPNDWQLVQDTLAGRPDAARRLAERLRCVPRMIACFNARRGRPLSTHDLEDLSQEVAIVILRKLETYQGWAALETWVHRIAFLEFMNFSRSRERLSIEGPESSTWDEVEAPAPASPDEYEFIERGLDELGPPESEIIRLKHYRQLTFDEIAETLDISPNTAKSRYYRGIAWLGRRLWSQVGEQGP